MKVILYIIALIVVLITTFGFNIGFGRFIFAGGSDGLMDLVCSDLHTRVLLSLIFFILVALISKLKNKYFYYPALILVFSLWFLSGRMIAIFPDGRISSGWFYIETDRFYICKTDIDCEEVFYYETEYKKEWFWKYRIKNNEVEEIILTSPFISKKIEKALSQKFNKSYPKN